MDQGRPVLAGDHYRPRPSLPMIQPCTLCAQRWSGLYDFFSDPEVRLIGYYRPHSFVNLSGLQRGRCACIKATLRPWQIHKFMQSAVYVNFDDLNKGILLFLHKTCGTTMSMRVGGLDLLYQGAIFPTRLGRDEQCPGFCTNQRELRACPSPCACAHIRQVVAMVAGWPRRGTAPREKIQAAGEKSAPRKVLPPRHPSRITAPFFSDKEGHAPLRPISVDPGDSTGYLPPACPIEPVHRIRYEIEQTFASSGTFIDNHNKE